MTLTDLQLCEPYSCRLSAESCARRYQHSQVRTRALHVAFCRACPVGKGNAAELGITESNYASNWSLRAPPLKRLRCEDCNEVTMMAPSQKYCHECRPIPRSGEKIGGWLVLREVSGDGRQRYWLCRCDCGVESRVSDAKLRHRHSRRCVLCARRLRAEAAE